MIIIAEIENKMLQNNMDNCFLARKRKCILLKYTLRKELIYEFEYCYGGTKKFNAFS